MASAAARERYARKTEGEDLKRAFHLIDRNNDGAIDAEELHQLFVSLGHKPKRGEVADLIWEVDEDCSGTIDWTEFLRQYHRARADTSGCEPHGFVVVVEFLMNDHGAKGALTMEEVMQIMYLRYGRAELDAKLEEVFGTNDLNSGKTFSLTEFMACLHSQQVRQLRARQTSKTYKPPLPGSGGGAG